MLVEKGAGERQGALFSSAPITIWHTMILSVGLLCQTPDKAYDDVPHESCGRSPDKLWVCLRTKAAAGEIEGADSQDARRRLAGPIDN